MGNRVIKFYARECKCVKCYEKSRLHSKHTLDVIRFTGGGLVEITLVSGKYYCYRCGKFFTRKPYWMQKGSKYCKAIIRDAENMVLSGTTLVRVSEALLIKYGLRVPPSTLHTWTSQPLFFPRVAGVSTQP